MLPSDHDRYYSTLWPVGLLIAAVLLGGAIYMWRFDDAPNRPHSWTFLSQTLPSTRPTTQAASGALEPPPVLQYFGPDATPISVKFENVSPKIVLDEIAKQSKYELGTYPPTLWTTKSKIKPISLAYDQQPFWPVLMQFCAAAGVYPYAPEGSRQILLYPGYAARVRCPGYARGPFLVVLNQITCSSVRDASTSNTTSELTLQFTLFLEPKITPLNFPRIARIEDARDDLGNDLDQIAESASSGSSSSPWSVAVSARLKCPRKPGQRIARLAGYVAINVQGERGLLEVDDVTKARDVGKMVGDTRVLFKTLTKTDRGYQAAFQIESSAERAAQRVANYPGLARLLDASGRQYRPLAGAAAEDGRSFTIDFTQPQRIGAPAKLTLNIISGKHEIKVPFEFKDLPLP